MWWLFASLEEKQSEISVTSETDILIIHFLAEQPENAIVSKTVNHFAVVPAQGYKCVTIIS